MKILKIAVAGVAAAGLLGAAPASASQSVPTQASWASGCTVTVGVSGTSSTPNRGYAKCAALNNGSRVRVKVRCWAGQDWQYGAWTSVQTAGLRTPVVRGLSRTRLSTRWADALAGFAAWAPANGRLGGAHVAGFFSASTSFARSRSVA